MEYKIINAACSDRDCFDELLPYIDKHTFSDGSKIVWDAIIDYYNSDRNAKELDKEILLNRLVRANPKGSDMFKRLLERDYNASPRNIVRELRDMQVTEVKADLQAAFSVHGNEDEIEKLLERYHQLRAEQDDTHETSVVHHGVGLDTIFDSVAAENRIKFSPPELQAATGGCLRGHHILIFGRPDMGKSTVATELIYGFLSQGLRVMYVGNEDPPVDLMSRFISRLLGRPIEQIQRNKAKASKLLMQRNWDKFYFVEMYPGTLKEIKAKVEEIRPDVLIVDQARNIKTGSSDRVRELELVERGLRNIGKQHNMVTISFTQAGDSAEGKSILNMSDVDNSKTGMQASADLMIGIGATEDDQAAGIRWLSYPKNKLSSQKDPNRVRINFNIFKVGG